MLKKYVLSLLVMLLSSGFAIAAVNINTATEAELDSLPGIGPAKAKDIVEYRKKNGNFKSVDDLKNVKGIGDKTIADLKPQITLTGATKIDTPPAAEKKEKTVKTDKKEMK